MPEITAIAGSMPHVLGVVNLRGLIIQVLDLPAIAGCIPKTGLNIMLVTEFARTTQAFAVESVEEIVRLDWSCVLSAERSAGNGGLVTSIARLDDDSQRRAAGAGARPRNHPAQHDADRPARHQPRHHRRRRSGSSLAR